MADANATTPGSSTAKTPAAKDKECPYCHQAFTSSSLGRHLDLYIKDKNAKPPDNLHNVEEIRRLRGNVTRRQARTSSGKREGSTPSSSKPTPLRDQRSPSIQGGSSSNHQHAQPMEGGHIRTYLNKPTWQSTGVINDIPSMRDHTSPSRVQSPSRRHSVKEEILHKQSILEERDRARAAELALKEVFDSVRAANSRAHPPSPFDFNFFNLSFPELCLRCLSAPRSLLSSPDMPESKSWSLDAPKAVHYSTLCDWVEKKLRSWHNLRHSQAQKHQLQATNGHLQEPHGADCNTDIENYKKHITSAYEAWKAMSDKKRQELWSGECAKAYAQEQEKHKETKRRLDIAEQKIQFLQSQLEEKIQAPEANMYPSTVLPLSRETTNQLPDSDTFNYESLLSKWKAKIKSTRSTQQPLPPASPWTSATPLNPNHTHSNGTTYPPSNHQNRSYLNPTPSNGAEHPSDEDEDEDLADAPGDEDDLEQQQNGMDRGLLDPNLANPDLDGDGQAGKMLMGLREYNTGNNGSGGGNGTMDLGKG